MDISYLLFCLFELTSCIVTVHAAINFLKNKPPGSFVIRNSNSFPGAFGLALRVARLPPNVQPKKKTSKHSWNVYQCAINRN